MEKIIELVEELIDDIERDPDITKTMILETLYNIKSKMEEKKEQLRLTKSRLKTLRRSTGQNIIDFFQGTNQEKKEEDLKDELTIQQILLEAGAYNLRSEVDNLAKNILMENPTFSKLDAYVKAYNSIIKD